MISCGFFGLCLALPGWSELPLYFPAKTGDRTIVRSPLVLEAVFDRREANQRVLHGGEEIVVGTPQEIWKQSLASELAEWLAKDFSAFAPHSDSVPNDTSLVEVSVFRFVAMPSNDSSPAWADVALDFKVRSPGGESGLVKCQARQALPPGACPSMSSTYCANIAGGLALRDCIEDFHKEIPRTVLRKKESPSKIVFRQVAIAAPPVADTGVQAMRHRWGIGFGGSVLFREDASSFPFGGQGYSYEPETLKWTIRYNLGARKNPDWGEATFFLGLGPKSEPSGFSQFLQGVAGWIFVDIKRSGETRSVHSDRILHLDKSSKTWDAYPAIGLRGGTDWDWDRKGEIGWGLEVSAMVLRLFGPFGEKDPWEESRPDEVPLTRFQLDVALCMLL